MADPQHPNLSATPDSAWVLMGRVSGVFGLRGWIKLISDTVPRDNLLQYSPWYLSRGDGWRRVRPLEGQLQGRGLVARLDGCAYREQAQALVGCALAVRREQLPRLEADDYYWSELEGLQVQTVAGIDLGRVSHVFETGANDVLVVQGERERLIPYLWEQVIKRVEIPAGRLIVDWDPDF